MGFTGTILAAKATRGVDVDRVLNAFDFGPPEEGDNGWFISEAHRHFDRAADYVGMLVTALGGPAFVVKVFDDEWAYLISAMPGSDPMVVILTPKALRAQLRGRRRLEPKTRRRNRRRNMGVVSSRSTGPVSRGQ